MLHCSKSIGRGAKPEAGEVGGRSSAVGTEFDLWSPAFRQEFSIETRKIIAYLLIVALAIPVVMFLRWLRRERELKRHGYVSKPAKDPVAPL
ncbi:hypothetical protein [Novosphingobium lentum]|uniref:hypothetical protein n=1 Tax=Novosphingobium lentum TaxID=145287 RepID=UPI00083703E6|nr:hypothetical protein [Novosphingobium lentum]